MRDINLDIAEAIQTFPNAKRIAVENFCWSAPYNGAENRANVKYDAGLYKWNSDTVNAILHTLRLQGKL